ncbi:MAG: hypothetical protein RLZ51_1881 [Pseudomonadota bacterium]|jgi:hypothetical protein
MKAIALIAALCAAPAAAQDALCLQRGEMMTTLEGSFGQVSIGYGHERRDAVVEVYVSARGTWTVLVTGPEGISCIAATGTDWVFVEQPWPGMGEEG